LIWINDPSAHPFLWCVFNLEPSAPVHMPPPRPKHCPICGVAMLASRSHGGRDADRFECLSCDLVINYSSGRRPRPPGREE
jgi:hypothetical protein